MAKCSSGRKILLGLQEKILRDYLILSLIFLAEVCGYLSNLSSASCKLWRAVDSEKDLSISGPHHQDMKETLIKTQISQINSHFELTELFCALETQY